MSGAALEFTKHTIPISSPADHQQVLQDIARMQDLVVVNIADSKDSQPVLLAEDSLRSLLAGGPNLLYVEAVPKGTFRKLAGQKIDHVIRSTLSLREILRERYVTALADEINSYQSEAQQLLLMLRCFALQKNQPGMAEHLDDLHGSLYHFAALCQEGRDNVRCMDQLQYQILPALKKTLKPFRK